MDVFEAIHTRRTTYAFTAEPVSRGVLERVLEAGVWAPNHHLTEPWRFTVVGEATKQKLADHHADLRLETLPADTSEAVRANKHAGSRQKFLDKPVIVAVSCRQEGDATRRREDYAATCCAIQTIMLAAWAVGLGVQWSTGPLTTTDRAYAWLGLEPSRDLVAGFLFIGYPAEVASSQRKPLADVLHDTP